MHLKFHYQTKKPQFGNIGERVKVPLLNDFVHRNIFGVPKKLHFPIIMLFFQINFKANSKERK